MDRIPGLNYQFRDPGLLRDALTHRSRGSANNERLEFLGDSILNFVVTSLLYESRPDDSEGNLSRLRSRVVRGETLARLAKGLRIGDYLIMGEGELKSGGFHRGCLRRSAPACCCMRVQCSMQSSWAAHTKHVLLYNSQALQGRCQIRSSLLQHNSQTADRVRIGALYPSSRSCSISSRSAV